MRVVLIGAAMLGIVVGVAPPGVAADASAIERLDRRLDSLVATPGGPPGAIVLVQRGNRLSVVTAGVARVGSSRPPRSTDTMRAASVSKAFSGAAALALVRQGRLELDDTIGERLPSLTADWHEVTLRQILQHTSGVPDFIAKEAAQRAVAASPRRAPAPRNLNRFMRAYVGGQLAGSAVRAQQRLFRAGGESEPPRPGANAAGLALFRYRTPCGTVLGHTGNTFGFTQFAAATPDGRRSVTVSVTSQISRPSPALLAKLRRVEAGGVCAALA